MSTVIEISVEQIKPDRTGVLQAQGIPPGVSPPLRVKTLYESAEELFLNLAAPAGIIADISIEMFAGIYPGNGLNAPDTPLEKIFLLIISKSSMAEISTPPAWKNAPGPSPSAGKVHTPAP